MLRRCLYLPATALLLSAASLVGCAGFGGSPTVRLSEAEITRLMERNFPVERSLLEVFDVSVSAPRVRLLPERNRLAAVVAVSARSRLFSGTWQGQLDFDAALRWDAATQSVRLSQVRVQDLALADPGALNRNALERLGAALAERVLENSVLYRLPAERAAQLREKGYEPGSVNVDARGLAISFVPLPAAPAPAR
ncbi:MAG: DUF1439 domain-containing protein [Rubrivivax sp.]|nr:DUF1439 domain-containing protein [Rubrivivax sp.]